MISQSHLTLLCIYLFFLFFFFNATATTEIYTLSLHDALPISGRGWGQRPRKSRRPSRALRRWRKSPSAPSARRIFCPRSEEHTSELQSRGHLVCRLLLEKKKNKTIHKITQYDNTNLLHLALSV